MKIEVSRYDSTISNGSIVFLFFHGFVVFLTFAMLKKKNRLWVC